MKYKWLNKQNNKKLIVFFNGWGMDEKIVSHLDFENFDLLMFYDYRDLEIENFNFSNYEEKYMIAWSMGVYTCNNFTNIFNNFDRKIAINGTLNPIHDEYGIPVLMYDLMIENFSEFTSEKFVNKISTGENLKEYCTRTSDELKAELIKIKSLSFNEFIKFDKAIVSLKDRIMPAKNQIRFWQKQNITPIEIKALHAIFNLYKKWSELL